VLGDPQLDFPQPPHPRERPADRADGGIGARAEVAEPPGKRLPRDRALDEIHLERLALGTVAGCLRTRDSLPHDRFPLASIHDASVPAVGEVEGQVRDEELDAERDARRHLALAQIRHYPDPALRMKAKPVEEFDDDLRRLVERMKALMVDAVGVGLAATQVGILRRLFVFDRSNGDGTAALVNPVIVERSGEVEAGDEGCLSLQGVLVPVERAVSLRIEGKDERGNDVVYDLEANPARCVQHELDHLDGVLIIDRTTPEARREALATLRPRLVLR
jgi:peptide deformylase